MLASAADLVEAGAEGETGVMVETEEEKVVVSDPEVAVVLSEVGSAGVALPEKEGGMAEALAF